MSIFQEYDHNPKRDIPIILGFVLASLVSSLLVSAVMTYNLNLGPGPFIGLVPITFLFSSLVTFVLGVPAFYLLFTLYKVTWWTTLAAGMVIGALAGYVFSRSVMFTMTCLVIGGVSALTFWVLWSHGQKYN